MRLQRSGSLLVVVLQSQVIECIMLFKEGIRPEWEDPENAGGGHFVVQLRTEDV